MKLLYFAWLKTKTGVSEEEVSPPAEVATVGELLTWLEGRGPEFADALSDRGAIRVAVNQAFGALVVARAQLGDRVAHGQRDRHGLTYC